MRAISIVCGALLAALAGCGSGKTVVLRPAQDPVRVSSVEVGEGRSTVEVPEETKEYFRRQLEDRLWKEEQFRKGSELRITYRFIQFNPGSQFSRWMLGGIGNAGEGTITVEASFTDAAETEIASIQADGRIGSGFFGGSFNSAVDRAVEEIAKYARQNFRKSAVEPVAVPAPAVVSERP